MDRDRKRREEIGIGIGGKGKGRGRVRKWVKGEKGVKKIGREQGKVLIMRSEKDNERTTACHEQ